MMPENTKTEDRKPKTENRLIWIFLAVATVALYFFGLDIPLLGPDEPRYSQVAREMFERGDWITPTLGGFDWFEKPALLYWLQIAAYHLFGVNEFAARFGSALFGLGTVLSVWLIGRRWSELASPESEVQSPESENRKPKTENRKPETKNRKPATDYAHWLALVAASSLGLIVFARGASFDIILTFPVAASLAGFFIWEISHRGHGGKGEKKEEIERAEQAELKEATQVSGASDAANVDAAGAGASDAAARNNSKSFSFFSVPSAALFCFYFFIGVALIAKGLVGAVFPLAIVAFYYLLSLKFPPRAFVFSLFWGGALSLLVAALWYWPMYRANGWKFIDEFFIQHHFQRYTSNKYLHPQPFWFFWVVLPLMTLPWLPFFFAALWHQIKTLRRNPQTRITSSPSPFLPFSPSPLLLFSFSWLIVPLVFFSFSGSKLPGYILPALPAALILTGDYVYRFVRKTEMRRRALQALALATFVVIAVLSQFETEFLREETVQHLVATAAREGYRTEKIMNLHTISHSVEFYGAGRTVRDENGKQKRFYGTTEIVQQMERDHLRQTLVVIPLNYLDTLTGSELVETRVLDDNGELAIVAVKKR